MNRLCKNCNLPIPKSITIDHKQKSLQNRSVCLECKPFQSDYKDQLIKNKIHTRRSFVCDTCNKNCTSKWGHKTCATCRSRINSRKNKKRAVDYLGGKCEMCGYNKSVNALHFHHMNQKEKKFSVSRYMLRSWNTIKNELDKCKLLCANCHAETHGTETE